MSLKATEAARELGVSEASLRRWSIEFEAALSAEANPGEKQRRFYTPDDMLLLHEAKRLFGLGKTTSEVASILTTIDPASLQEPATDTPNLPALPDAFERLTDALTTIADQKQRIDALEARLDAIERQERRSWWDKLRGR